jgi:hypothetical protein
MTPFRKLLLVTLSAAALGAIEACSSGTELNPQPLPPESNEPTQGPGENDGKGAGSSGSMGTPPPSAADASVGDSGDAADGGEQ